MPFLCLEERFRPVSWLPDQLERDAFSRFPAMAAAPRGAACRDHPRLQWRDRCGFAPHSMPRNPGYQ